MAPSGGGRGGLLLGGTDESGGGQDQPEHGDESQVGGTGEGPGEHGGVEAGNKHVEHGDESGDAEEVHNSDADGLFHFDFLLRRRRFVFCLVFRGFHTPDMI